MKTISRISLFFVLMLLFTGAGTLMAQDEPVTLRLSSWQWDESGFGDFWRATTAAFTEEHPNVTFEPFAFPSAQLWDKLNIEIAAGNAPDIMMFTGFNVFSYLDQDILAPLDACFEGTNIPEVVKDQTSYVVRDGQMYALNLAARTLQLYVNRQLFDEAGVAVPTNFEEFEAAAIALTDPAKDQYGLVLTNLAHSRFYESILNMVTGYGGHFAVDGVPTLNSPEVIQGIEYFKRLFDEGVMPQGVKDGGVQNSYFNSGKVAMTIDGAWYFATLEQQAPELLPFVEIYPMPTDTHAATGGINNVIGISATTEHYDIACDYLKSIATVDWGHRWVELTKTIYAVEGSVTDEFLQEFQWFDAFNDGLDDAVPVAAPGLEVYHNEIQQIVVNKVVEILYNGRPIEEAMNEAQAEVEALIGL